MKTRQSGKTKPARQQHPIRVMPALSRLSLLVAMGLAPGMAAQGASYTDSVSFSATGVNLWGSAGGTAIATNLMQTAWGSYAGADPTEMFKIGGISRNWFGDYGAEASMSSSGRIGLEVSSSARGGSLDFSQSFTPLLTLPDTNSLISKQIFTVSARDTLGAAAKLTPYLPSVQASISGTFDFNARISVLGCVIACTGASFDFGLNPGKFPLLSYDSGAKSMLTMFGVPVPTPILGKETSIGAGTVLIDTVKNSDCSGVGGGGLHCANDVLRGGWELVSMLPPFYGAENPLHYQASKNGVTVKTDFLSVNAGPAVDMAFDFAPTVSVFTKLVFDKPVQEILTNANGSESFINHFDGMVSFALGSDIKLRFDGDVGKLTGRNYYLGDASVKTSVSADLNLSLRNSFVCGVEISVPGFSLGGTESCLYQTESNASLAKLDVYSGSTQINGVRTTTVLQGGSGPIDQFSAGGQTNYHAGAVLKNRGRGVLTTFASGSSTDISGSGSRMDNGDYARALLVAGASLTVAGGGRIDNTHGAQIEIASGGVLQVGNDGTLYNEKAFVEHWTERVGKRDTYIWDQLNHKEQKAVQVGCDDKHGDFDLGTTKATCSYSVNEPRSQAHPDSLISNFGLLIISGKLSNHGVIDNNGSLMLMPDTRGNTTSIAMDSAGGSINNRGTLSLMGGLVLGSPNAGSFNLLSGKVEVSGPLSIAAGYTQVLGGEMALRTGGSLNIAGTLQVGRGGDVFDFMGNPDGSWGWLNGAATVAKGGMVVFNLGGANGYNATLSGEGSVHFMGPGVLAMSEPQLYTGATEISGGRLQVYSTTQSGEFNIGGSGALEFLVTGKYDPPRDFERDTRFIGTGVLRKIGLGHIVWSRSAATFAMGAGGLIDVVEGSLVGGSFGNESWVDNQADLRVGKGGAFYGVEANVRVGALSGEGRIESGYPGAGYSSFVFGVADRSGSFAGVLANTSTNTSGERIGNFTKVGSGTQTLTGANSFTGVLSIEAGTVRVGDGGTQGSLATRSIVNNAALVFARSDDTLYEGVIAGSGSLYKQGAGTLRLIGDHSYTGPTSVEAGRLVQEGALRTSGYSISRGAVLDLQVDQGSRNGAVDVQFVGAGVLRKSGAGTARWAQTRARFAMEQGGLIDVQGGTLVGGSYANEDWTLNKSGLNVAAGAVFDGDEANVRVDALSGAGRIKSGYGGSGYSAFTFGVGNGSGHFSGVLANSESTGNFVKEGTGTQVLSGINTYTGTTRVQAGELTLNGSSLSSAFSVDAGASLGGSGALGSLVLAGKLAPGNSPGQLSVAGNATFAEGASYLWEIANASAAAGLGYDLLSVGGTLSLDASAANPFTVTLKSLLANGGAGLLAGFDAQHNHSYTLAYASGGILGFSAKEFSIDGSGFANSLMGGHWSVAATGNALNLNFTAAVPEPESYAMLLAGLLVVGRVARRRLGGVARP